MSTRQAPSISPDTSTSTTYYTHDIDLPRKRNRWHPKLSPYRLWVILTTVAFGTAKTVESQSGNNLLPTTLEWVAGTVLFLITFILGTYENEKRADIPRFLLWMFERDCMDVVWRLCALLSINPPKYDTQESVPVHVGNGGSNVNVPRVVISQYRLLVSLTVLVFGMSKALLGYFGQSTSMNWTDWLLGVPLSTCLYILGLYEYNQSNIWPRFFVVDRKDAVLSATSHVFITGPLMIWFILSILGIVWILRYPAYISKLLNPHPEGTTIRRFLYGLFYNTIRTFIIAILCLAAFSLLRALGQRLPRLQRFAYAMPRQGLQVIRWLITGKVTTGPIIGTPPNVYRRTWSSLVRTSQRARGVLVPFHYSPLLIIWLAVKVHPMFKPLRHVFLHVMGLVGGVLFGGFMAHAAWAVYDSTVSGSIGGTRSKFVAVIVYFDMGLFAAGPVLVLGFVISSFFRNYPVHT